MYLNSLVFLSTFTPAKIQDIDASQKLKEYLPHMSTDDRPPDTDLSVARTPCDEAGQTVSTTDYRDAISRFLTGVSVVSSRHAGIAHGITASAVASVTLEPPTVLVCLNRQSATGHAVKACGHFVINVLNDSQHALAKHFASKLEDKFAGIEHDTGVLGDPLLPNALAQLECRVSSQADVGSHHVFFGEVIKIQVRDGAPLAYFRGRFIPPQA